MNILSETDGQTCNKFWQYIYYLNIAVKSNTTLYVQLPDKTIEDYPNLNNNNFIKFPFYFTKLTKVIGFEKSLWFTHMLTVLFLNNYVRFILHWLSFKKINFLSGKPTWNQEADYSNLLPLLRNLFSLAQEKRKPVDKAIKKWGDKTLIGVHIRGGDYKTWRGGKYYFDVSVYINYMRKIQTLLNEKCVFYISTNEKISESDFAGFDVIKIDNIGASQDLYGLSCCKYLIGTVSSFNAWVSFVWEIPLYTIETSEKYDEMSLSDFSTVVCYNHKKNGFRFPWNQFFFKPRHPWLYKHSNNETIEKK